MNRKELMKELQLKELVRELKRVVELNMGEAVQKIEELEQDKLYYIIIDNSEDADKFMKSMSLIKTKLKWTVPNIIVLSKPLEQINIIKLKEIIRLHDKR